MVTRWCGAALLFLAAAWLGVLHLHPPVVLGQGHIEEARGALNGGGRTWYVRQDGGDRTQCQGTTDAPYRGSGTSQACAFKNPYYLFTNDTYGNKRWVVAGGDTILLRGGPYRMGYKGPEAKDGWGSCPGDPYGCSMPPLPSGTEGRPTRLLGEEYASCGRKTELYGGYALGAIVDLSKTQHAEVECLELTDHSQCSRDGANLPLGDQCRSDFPLSDYAGTGIVTDSGTADVLLKDLDIHGLVSRGILGPVGGLITADHVRIGYNGGAGWDFDDGRGTRSAPDAQVVASYLTIEWNGCNEEYPRRHTYPVYSCFDQDDGGYGDGVGTPDTRLSFACDHCLFRYNTQDGLDLLHVSGSVISITNSSAYGNMGQQWKLGAMKRVVFRRNTTVNNCRRMSADMEGAPGGYNRGLSLFCRAGGEGFAMAVSDGGEYLLQNNSFAGYGATSYEIGCQGRCRDTRIVFQNNLSVGYVDPGTGNWPSIFDSAEAPLIPFRVRDHNFYYRMRTCPWGWTEHCADPGLYNMPTWSGEASLDGIDFRLTNGSLARAAGVEVDGLSEAVGAGSAPRGVDIGAYAYRP